MEAPPDGMNTSVMIVPLAICEACLAQPPEDDCLLMSQTAATRKSVVLSGGHVAGPVERRSAFRYYDPLPIALAVWNDRMLHLAFVKTGSRKERIRKPRLPRTLLLW